MLYRCVDMTLCTRWGQLFGINWGHSMICSGESQPYNYITNIEDNPLNDIETKQMLTVTQA